MRKTGRVDRSLLAERILAIATWRGCSRHLYSVWLSHSACAFVVLNLIHRKTKSSIALPDPTGYFEALDALTPAGPVGNSPTSVLLTIGRVDRSGRPLASLDVTNSVTLLFVQTSR
jgi:hypothetical protein